MSCRLCPRCQGIFQDAQWEASTKRLIMRNQPLGLKWEDILISWFDLATMCCPGCDQVILVQDLTLVRLVGEGKATWVHAPRRVRL